MTDATNTDTATETATETGEQKQQEQQTESFTKAQVDAIVAQRLKQQATNKFGDYDELKTKAAGAQTLEERLAGLETELSGTKAAALRTRVAADFGISTKKGPNDEPSDADLFLTGTDESTLTAQAQRLAARQADSKKQGNVAPKEGETKTTGTSEEAAMRELASKVFGGSD